MDTAPLISALKGSQPKEVIVCDDQTTNDIIRQILAKHRQCTGDYDKIYTYFLGGDLEEICLRIWTFCKKKFNYVVEDEKAQYTSCPLTMLQNGDVDCKNYSLFTAGILDAIRRNEDPGIHWKFRFASYSLLQPWVGHVFVVVNPNTDNIWIDPVLDRFNDHEFYWYHIDKNPRTKQVGAIGRVPMARIGNSSAGQALLDQLDEYTQGLIQAMTLSKQTKTINVITAAVLNGAANAVIPGITVALQAIKLLPYNNAFGPGSVAARVITDFANLDVIGMFNDIFNGRTYGSDSYWACVYYKFYVLGQQVTDQNQISDSDVLPCLQWFIDRTGVFISGRQHIIALTQSASAYMAYYGANNYTTMDPDRVAAAVLVAKQWWNTPPGNYDQANKGAWAGTVGVFDTGLVQIANAQNETAETLAKNTNYAYAAQEVAQGGPVPVTTQDNQLIPGVDNAWLYGLAGLLFLYGLS